VSFLSDILNFGAWLIQALLNLIIFLINLALRLVEGVIMLLPDPSSMPGLPGVGSFSWDISWIAALVDMSAIGQLFAFIAQGEALLLTILFLRWAWGWVKW
jgi:hypothetical protein